MALTRDYKQTVLADIKRDPKFARALCAEAFISLLEGETEVGLSILRDLVHANASAATLRQRAKAEGMRTLREDGIRKVLAGQTTIAEVASVTIGDID